MQNEAERHRLANRGLKRSVLGAGIAASKEVLNPGQKTPYSPKHVMTPHGPMVLAPEGPVPPTQHPFVQEQMSVLKCIKQVPCLFRRILLLAFFDTKHEAHACFDMHTYAPCKPTALSQPTRG